ncbi:MAG: hypothetical protein LUE24_07505 [Lachnospiraceae bacterium]|nr:hypothetical protein [Lachnospiraceae bacterium]
MFVKELPYFQIGTSYGGCQDWFTDPMMRLGGCAAATACDSCIYFDLHRPDLAVEGIPFSTCRKEGLSRQSYVAFAMVMKPYLRPRMGGVDRLELYLDGMSAYLYEHGIRTLAMEGLPGETELRVAREKLCIQIDSAFPVPCLLLKHQDSAFKEYEWHWFLLTGYRVKKERLQVKAVTYSEAEWLDFAKLWDTGRDRKDGLILYRAASGGQK